MKPTQEIKDAFVSAADAGDDARVLDFIGRYPDALTWKNSDGVPALNLAAYACRETTVLLLLDRGAGIDAPSDQGLTPLMSAVLGFDADIVRLLLDRGADIHAIDMEGRTARSFARGPTRVEIADILDAHVEKMRLQDEAVIDRLRSRKTIKPFGRSPRP